MSEYFTTKQNKYIPDKNKHTQMLHAPLTLANSQIVEFYSPSSQEEYETFSQYTASLRKHIELVIEAGTKFICLPYEHMKKHDASKFTELEFRAYAHHFYGKKNPEAFARAWLHHLHNNPHHWDYWVFADRSEQHDNKKVKDGVMEMDKIYALEMIADWMGASKAYGEEQSWDITQWYKDKKNTIQLHPKTRKLVENKINELSRTLNWEYTF